MKNRYIFFKRLYSDYLLLFTKKEKLIAFNIDNTIISILENSSDTITKILTDKNISLFQILDNKLQEKTRSDSNWKIHIQIFDRILN